MRCKDCQYAKATEPEHPIFNFEVPGKSWNRLYVNFTGPRDGVSNLIMISSLTKWAEVISMTSMTAEAVIKEMRDVFGRLGIPEKLALAQINFDESWMGINPYHPRSNGLAKRFVQTFTNLVIKS
ncbi:hypothetical protein ACOME3_008827 [Neoechinorhynchus agilis]